MAAMIAARMVARLAGPLPVRLAEVSSLNVVSRIFSRGGARQLSLISAFPQVSGWW
jgi:hypothetical protein